MTLHKRKSSCRFDTARRQLTAREINDLKGVRTIVRMSKAEQRSEITFALLFGSNLSSLEELLFNCQVPKLLIR